MGLCDVELSAVFPTRTVCTHTLVSGSPPCSSAGTLSPLILSRVSLGFLWNICCLQVLLGIPHYEVIIMTMYVQVSLVRIKWMCYVYLFPFFTS